MRCYGRLKHRHAAYVRRVPLPPQQLLVMAAALSVAAVAVAVMITTGALPWAVVTETDCDPQFGNHCWDKSHCTITSREEEVKSYNVWQQCLAVLCDAWRNTGRGSGRRGGQNTLVAGRNHLPLKSPLFLSVTHFQLPSCHNALHRISLSIRILLFMLLVVAGDVERNPGPPKYGGKWNNVTDQELTEDDVYNVYEEVYSMAGNWSRIAVGLRLPLRIKSVIAKKHPGNPDDCLLAVLEEWLKRVHDVRKYGPPSWRVLVQAVADPAGGANPALAHSIAAKHPVTSEPNGKSDADGTVHQEQTVVPTSVMGGCNVDPRKGHHLSAKFAKVLAFLGSKLNECTNVDDLKKFLNLYSHPLYPEKRYIDPHVYHNANTVEDIVFSLFPHYINYMQHCILEEIVDGFGDEECKERFQEYEQFFQMSMRKLRDHPAPVTDEEIEQSKGQKRLKITTSGDARATTPHDLHTVEEAIEQATGLSQAGQVFVHQDASNSVTFTFLIPDCVVQLFYELCSEDLTVLADAGIIRIQVEDLEMYITKVKATQKSAEESMSEAHEASSLECYLEELPGISCQQRTDLIPLLRSVPGRQLNEVCSELLEFSRHIQSWKMLAPCLDKNFHYDEFRATYSGIEEQNYQLLQFWRKREGNNATYYHLLETIMLYGTEEEMRALFEMLSAGAATDTVCQQLKERYIQHANISNEDGMQVDTRMVQLKDDASDQVRELNYYTRLETAEEFRDKAESVSLRQVMNTIAAAMPGTCISIAGPCGIGKTTFIRRMCHCWALGYALRQYRLLFSIDLSTAAGQPLNDLSQLLTAALTCTQAFTETEIRNVVRSVMEQWSGRALVVLDHFSQQHSTLLSNLLSSKKITVVVSSFQAVKCVRCENRFHVLGMTDRQTSQQVLHYYNGDQYRAERFLQYLSSVPNFNILKRVPVYLYGLLCVFDIISTAPPPCTLMSFLSCLALLMLNLSQNELSQTTELLTSESVLDTLNHPPSPSWSLLQIICQVAYKESKSLFHKTELVARPTVLSLMRPVHIAFPLQSGEWLLLTQYPLLQDFLVSLHLCGQQRPVEETVQYLNTNKKLHYFCTKLMPHIQTEVVNLSHMYEDDYISESSSKSVVMSHTAVSARIMYWLIFTARKVTFTKCDFSSAAAAILSSCIGHNSRVYSLASERWVEYVSSDPRSVFVDSADSAVHPLVLITSIGRSVTSSSRFDTYSWLNFLREMSLSDCAVQEMNLDSIKIGPEQREALEKALIVNQTLRRLSFQSSNIGADVGVTLGKALTINQTLQEVSLQCNTIGDRGAKAVAAGLRANHSLRNLRLDQNKIGHEGGVALGEALTVNKTLQELSLKMNAIGDTGAAAVAAGLRSNHSLQILILAQNKIEYDGGVALGNALAVNNTLQELSLRINAIGDRGAAAVAAGLRSNHSLQILILAQNKIEYYGGVALGDALAVNNTLQELSLRINVIGDRGAAAVAAGLRSNHSLQILILDWNEIGSKGVTALGEALAVNQTLQELSLERNKIGPKGGVALSEALTVNQTLRELRIERNSIGDNGATALAAGLKHNTSLQGLSLGWNGIGPEGGVSLGEALTVNQTLQTLSLEDNHIRDKGAAAVAKGLIYNPSLKSLRLAQNKIERHGGVALGQILAMNDTLQELSVEHNAIGDEGAEAVASGLSSNHSLRSLNLDSNNFGTEGGVALGKVLSVNQTLQSLSLSDNSIGVRGAKAVSKSLKVNHSLRRLKTTWEGLSFED